MPEPQLAPTDERTELDRLRKVKRLRELEAKAAGSAQAPVAQGSDPLAPAVQRRTPFAVGVANDIQKYRQDALYPARGASPEQELEQVGRVRTRRANESAVAEPVEPAKWNEQVADTLDKGINYVGGMLQGPDPNRVPNAIGSIAAKTVLGIVPQAFRDPIETARTFDPVQQAFEANADFGLAGSAALKGDMNAAADFGLNAAKGYGETGLAAMTLAGGGKFVNLPAARAPKPTQPSAPPITAVPPTAPRAAQGGQASAGQQPAAGPPTLNASPVQAPVGTVPKHTQFISRQLLQTAGVARNDVDRLLTALVDSYETFQRSGSEFAARYPFGRYVDEAVGDVARQAGVNLPEITVRDVRQAFRGRGRTAHGDAGPGDKSRATMSQTIGDLRGSQKQFLTEKIEGTDALNATSIAEQKKAIAKNAEEIGKEVYGTSLDFAGKVWRGEEVARPGEIDALTKLKDYLMRSPFRQNMPQELKIMAELDEIPFEARIQSGPAEAAHWLQSRLGQLSRDAKGTPMARIYGEMRSRLLKELDASVPGYKSARADYGDEFLTLDAADFGRSFFADALRPADVDELATAYKGMTARQKTMARMSIRDELFTVFKMNPEEASLRLDKLTREGTLEALETILGKNGKRVSDLLREMRKESLWLAGDRQAGLPGVDALSGSNTVDNFQVRKNDAKGVRTGPQQVVSGLGDKAQLAGALVADAGIMAVGSPVPIATPVLLASKLQQILGNPSRKVMSESTEGIFGMPKQLGAPAPPPGAARATRGPPKPKAPLPEGKRELLELHDSTTSKAERKRIRAKLRTIREAEQSQLPAPGSPPAKRPINKAGFGFGSSPPARATIVKDRLADRGKRTIQTESGKKFIIEMEDNPAGTVINFRQLTSPEGYRIAADDPFKPTGAGSAEEAFDIVRATEQALREEIQRRGAHRYIIMGNTPQQRRIYEMMAARREPPEGYVWDKWEQHDGQHLALVRKDTMPPDATGPGAERPELLLAKRDEPQRGRRAKPAQSGFGPPSKPLPTDEGARMERASEWVEVVPTKLDAQSRAVVDEHFGEGFADIIDADQTGQQALYYAKALLQEGESAEQMATVALLEQIGLARKAGRPTEEGSSRLLADTGGSRTANGLIDWGVPAASGAAAYVAQPEGTSPEQRLAMAGMSALGTKMAMPAARAGIGKATNGLTNAMKPPPRYQLKPANDRPIADRIFSPKVRDAEAEGRAGYFSPSQREYPRDLIQDDNGTGVKARFQDTGGSYMREPGQGANDGPWSEAKAEFDASLMEIMTPDERALFKWGKLPRERVDEIIMERYPLDDDETFFLAPPKPPKLTPIDGGKKPPPKGPPTKPINKMTFGGINAKTADKQALSRAQQMEGQGASREDIWNATGWFKGKDGKWRFEIDDSGFKGRVSSVLRGKGELKDFFHDADAGGAYPEIAKAPTKRSAEFGGGYDHEGGGRIEFSGNPATRSSGRSVAAHERQHAIQHAEGFSEGGSPSLSPYKFQDPADQAKWDTLASEARSIMREVDIGELSWRAKNAARVRAEPDIPESVRRHHLANEPGANLRAYLDRYNELRAELDAMMPRALSGEETYIRLAGEVEARNVQKRLNFSPEKRRRIPPWKTEDVSRDQQIVRFGSGRSDSRGGPPKGPEDDSWKRKHLDNGVPEAWINDGWKLNPGIAHQDTIATQFLRTQKGNRELAKRDLTEYVKYLRTKDNNRNTPAGKAAADWYEGALPLIDSLPEEVFDDTAASQAALNRAYDKARGMFGDTMPPIRVGPEVPTRQPGKGGSTSVDLKSTLPQKRLETPQLKRPPSGGPPKPPSEKNGLKAQPPRKAKGPPLSPVQKGVQDLGARDGITGLLKRRMEAAGDELVAIDAEIAVLKAKAAGPRKPTKPPLTDREERAKAELSSASRAYNAADRKWITKADREARVRPLEDRLISAQHEMSEAQKAASRQRGRQVIVRKARNALQDARVPLAITATATAAGVAGLAAVNGLKGPPKEGDKPISTRDPRYYWEGPNGVTKNHSKMLKIQTALEQAGFWPEKEVMVGGRRVKRPVEQNGVYGSATKDAIRAWRADKGLDPDKPMTEVDVQLLLAPKGYYDKDDTYRYGNGELVPTL
jgi:hypothetical protein